MHAEKPAVAAAREKAADSTNAVSNQERDNRAVERAQKLIGREPTQAEQKEGGPAAEESAIVCEPRVAERLPCNKGVEHVSRKPSGRRAQYEKNVGPIAAVGSSSLKGLVEQEQSGDQSEPIKDVVR